jgi:endonuclease I
MKSNFVIIILIMSAMMIADPPPGYYDGAEGLSGEALKAALNDIVDNHTGLSYAAAYIALRYTDKDPANSDNVILLYTGWSVTNAGYPTWNREHVWAKSHGDFGTSMGPGTDIHHLRPTDPGVNSSRGNKDFDNGGTQHSVATGCYYDEDSWEPRDEVKGDVARMIFYMSVRYEGEGGDLDLEVVDAVNTYPLPQHGKLSALLEWNMIDPPDDFEENRNDVIYEDYQGNRNPFVDDPNYANLIWQDINVDFLADPTQGEAPLNVQFTDETVSAGNIIDWSWDLDGDGSEDSNLQNPTFSYIEEGIYSVTLTIEDEFGEFSTHTKTDYILVGSSNIPSTIFADSFEQGVNWNIYSVSSSYNWERTDEYAVSSHPDFVIDGNWYYYMNNFGSDMAANDWLISPAIDLYGYENPYVYFQAWTKYTDSVLGFDAFVSSDYPGSGNPENYNWQSLDTVLPAANSESWIFSGNAGLSDYQDQTVYIAFQYTSSGNGASASTAWAVDNINVEGYENSGVQNIQVASNFNLFNYPNPFNPSTEFRFQISDFSKLNSAEISIYNLKGQLIKSTPVILSGFEGSITWNGTDSNNKPVTSGIYFYKLSANGKTLASNKCLLLK